MHRNWVGGHMRPPYSQGQLVREGAFNAHQHIRTQSSLSDNPDIPEIQDKHVNKVKARQYNHSRIHKQQRTIVLVAPIWQGQTWWPLLLQLAIRSPVILPSTPETLENPANPTTIHPMFPRLHLAIWLVSNDPVKQETFRNMLPDFSQPLLVNRLTRLTTPYGENGVAGVIDGKLIQFQQV